MCRKAIKRFHYKAKIHPLRSFKFSRFRRISNFTLRSQKSSTLSQEIKSVREMSNVTVCARFRPLNSKEKLETGDKICIHNLDPETFVLKDEKEGEFTFCFDKVFYHDSKQSDVYEFLALPIVKDAVNAINGTIIIYGQTGAGKTYSMEGNGIMECHGEEKGLLPRVVDGLFECLKSLDEMTKYTVKLSMVEIYKEKVRDLFDLSKDNLQIKESKLHGIYLTGVTEAFISDPAEASQNLSNGAANRAVGETQMNMASSRSHCVYIFTIQLDSANDRRSKSGKLILVDLAGSEKVEKTGAEGKVLDEAKTINKSLSALGNVINALTNGSPGKTNHIPYRDSKLTRFLQDSLGGNCRTALLCCCSPSTLNSSESLSTIRFGARAKHIKTSPKATPSEDKVEKKEMNPSAVEDKVKKTEMIPSAVKDDSNSCQRILNKLSEKMEVEDVKLLEELLIKEGIIYNPNSIEIDFEPAVEDLTPRTITILQQTVEELSSTVDKLKRENKALKDILKDILLADAGRLNIQGEDVEGYANYYEKISGGSKIRSMSTQQQPTTYSVNKTVAQYTIDARLDDVFEQSGESGKCFNYLQCLKSTSQSIPDEQINTYLSRVQRGGHVQPFGCMIAAQESLFRVIAYSENASEMLDSESLAVGTDVRTLFTPSSASFLEKAFSSRNISKPFFAILHKIDVGIVIDLEPARAGSPAFSISGAVQSQKLADRAILRLQALPGGDIKTLCYTVVELVRELTGYDRVIVYKFHEDDHGEVVAESKRSDLEPYMGLHFPSTDIPQASRLLFEQNRVRIIVDCHARPVSVVQDEELMQPLCLVGSTLRAPHGCHTEYMANMGSVASLAMSVIISENGQEGSEASGVSNSMRLWGLVVCHHTSARCISFPLRYACGFLIQVFGLQLRLELQLASLMQDKHVLQTQALLCNILLRDSPAGVITQSPSIMDLVKCDGAALIYQGNYFTIGICPAESQIKDIVEWLLSCHGDSTGLSTDGLAGAGFPGASALGDTVCGMAVAYITSRDILFLFRSSARKEIKWGGAKHSPQDNGDSQRMHPRSSFKVFLEIVKSQSLPWEIAEMDAVHSLQLILRNSIRDINRSICESGVNTEVGSEDCQGMDERISVAKEIVRLIETANAPVFAVDSEGRINGWNTKIAELIGLPVEEAIGKFLLQDLIYKEYVDDVNKFLSRALRGKEDKNVEIKLKTFGPQKLSKSVLLVVNACSSKDYVNNIVGVSFVGQDITSQKVVLDRFIRLQGDYKAIFHNPNPLIEPIFASDENMCCLEEEMLGKMLVGDIFGSCCRLESTDARTKFTIALHNAIGGQDTDKIPFQFYEKNGVYVKALLTATKRVNLQGEISGAFCFLQIVSPELQHALEVQRQEKKCCARKKQLAYICQEVKNSLRGLHYMNSLLEATDLSEDQKQGLETSAACERQMMKIIRDVDLECIEDGSLEYDEAEFSLGNLINAVVGQVMTLLRERGLQLMHDIPEEIKTLAVIGDQVRIQQVLVNFLLSAVQYTPSPGGWVEIQVQSSPKKISNGKELLHLEFRIGCPGEGLPLNLCKTCSAGSSG
ncbi:hypothetical protein MKW98_004569 [Papaver atlanticum]|uniref:Kinesin-like protein KIN-1 n=1 Tax=Papaver atlanticum TaxID=357466 RepID=A0AAD4XII1_9MAGN|nr:hypothetical protein MKW98_004569 [Papaver atlanticum]